MPLFWSKLLTPLASPLTIACALMAIVVWSVRKRPRLARGAAVAALLILLAAGNPWLGLFLAGRLEVRHIPRAPLPAADAIVVLASGGTPAIPPQPEVRLDDATANRLLYGARLYREGKAPIVILSGGRLPWQERLPPISQIMATAIETMGVSAAAIIQEPASGNTYQNALEVKAILESRGFHRILLVTSAMHMPRALALFTHQGVDAIAAPCDFIAVAKKRGDWQDLAIDLAPDAGILMVTTMAIREMVGAAVYRAAGLL
jgi:uncharacterized SAM-binding protein YcdF (DUF218 family)